MTTITDEIISNAIKFPQCPECGGTMYPVNGRPRCIMCGKKGGIVNAEED